MVLQILLVIALIFQIIAAIIAMRLTQRTKFNVAWILFSLAILLITYEICVELWQIHQQKPESYKAFSMWSTAILSLCMSIGIFYVKKILGYIESINNQRAQAERQLLSTIIMTEEKERQRFSKDLHDGLGPLLSSAKMSTSVLNKLDNTPQSSEIIGNITYVIDESIKEVRAISNNISPAILADFGIARALNNFISRLSLPSEIKMNYTTNVKDQRYTNNIEVVFYRIGCELINNAIKHSKASKIDVSLEFWGRILKLTVEDNGIGMSKNLLNKNGTGMGYKNIVSRLELLNGTVEYPNQAKGTKVVIKIIV